METTAEPAASPPRTTAPTDSYAIRVTEDRIDVWKYRVSFAESDGEWVYEETLDREDEPRLSIESTALGSPASDGYWLYSQTYTCTLECK